MAEIVPANCTLWDMSNVIHGAFVFHMIEVALIRILILSLAKEVRTALVLMECFSYLIDHNNSQNVL